MGKPYWMDLRARVVATVDRSELSRHPAAAQFGVEASRVRAQVCSPFYVGHSKAWADMLWPDRAFSSEAVR
jgi:hypothetical protein